MDKFVLFTVVDGKAKAVGFKTMKEVGVYEQGFFDAHLKEGRVVACWLLNSKSDFAMLKERPRRRDSMKLALTKAGLSMPTQSLP